jgi:hypothetical protein
MRILFFDTKIRIALYLTAAVLASLYLLGFLPAFAGDAIGLFLSERPSLKFLTLLTESMPLMAFSSSKSHPILSLKFSYGIVYEQLDEKSRV